MPPRRFLAAACAVVALTAGTTAAVAAPDPVVKTTNAISSSFADTFADPSIMEGRDGYWYAYATSDPLVANGPFGLMHMARTKDFSSWEYLGTVFDDQTKPAWAAPGSFFWAPDIRYFGGRYVMYFTVTDTVASKPEGPYVDKSSSPLINQVDEGGSIDASPFRDSSGKRWLYWKNDGNAIGVDTWISVSELSADGLTLIGPTHRLIKQTLPWEGNLVEAPSMVERNGKFHLFYSANAYDKAAYAVGHALCATPTGPCMKSGDPILVSSNDAAGPGHTMILRKDDRDWFVYHAWNPAAVGTDPHGRTMWLSELTWTADTPTVQPPLRDNPNQP